MQRSGSAPTQGRGGPLLNRVSDVNNNMTDRSPSIPRNFPVTRL
ncbi:hypothetical protein B005_0829 [Nocardiopsis alba ATCC BAA-2165]|uniref:Uncharacterized protein n=1 Tax=Nocardiopsis alba (strain ATCC BAA-2165 / BE74) TaxID=1205910 RepID=J7LB80_NOCAA|nr:hypothetical protein B005_0829 [Nocardiopsis alba ATCC BAA-2165]